MNYVTSRMRENHKRARYIIFWLLYDQHRNIQKNRLYKSCDIKRNYYKKSQYRINLFESYSCLSKYMMKHTFITFTL